MKTLKTAEEAVAVARTVGKRTRDLLAYGNCNPYPGVPGSQIRAPKNVDIGRLVGTMRNEPNPMLNSDESPARYLYDACTAIRYKCGNCGEHAKVAFMLLISMDLGNFDLVGYDKNTEESKMNYDHAFVRINCDNRDYVICDPWADRYEESRFVANPRIDDNWSQSIWGKDSPNVKPTVLCRWNPI